MTSEMPVSEAIRQLNGLREHCRCFADIEDASDVWTADIAALDTAIASLEGQQGDASCLRQC